MAPLTVTIDTNCINARSSLSAMTQLEQLHSEGRVQLVKTDVLDTELSGWGGRRGQRARTKSAPLREDIGVWVLGHSRLGHTRLASEGDAALYDEIATVIFDHPLKGLHKRQVRDVMVLVTHIKFKRDILVTLDKDLLDKVELIRRQFAVTVLRPGECLERVEGVG